MKGIKIFFYVVVGFISLLVVGTLIFFLAEDTITSLRNPEWTKFHNDMMNAYPEIDRISYYDVGEEFGIQYYMKSSLDWDKTEEMFENTRVFMLSEQGFDTVNSLNSGSLGSLKVRFSTKDDLKDKVEFFSYCSKRECTAQDFTKWTVYYMDELWDYQEDEDSE